MLPVEVQPHAAGTPSQNSNPVCFEVPSAFEITVEGRKLIGSAQARRKEGVLQHGSFPLYGDLRRILEVLVYPDENARQQAGVRLLERATTVEAALGRRVSWDEAARAFVGAFTSVFNLEMLPSELTGMEKERAVELVQQKYSHPEQVRKGVHPALQPGES